MSCVRLCTRKDFPLESNSFSNGSLFKYAKKDVLLWVTDTGKINKPKHPEELSRERTEPGHPAVSEELQSDKADHNALEQFSAHSPTTTTTPPPGPTHMVCQNAEEKRFNMTSAPS